MTKETPTHSEGTCRTHKCKSSASPNQAKKLIRKYSQNKLPKLRFSNRAASRKHLQLAVSPSATAITSAMSNHKRTIIRSSKTTSTVARLIHTEGNGEMAFRSTRSDIED